MTSPPSRLRRAGRAVTLEHVTPRLRLPLLVGGHLLVSSVIAAAFVWRFGQASTAVAGHALLIAEWDIAIAALLIAICIAAVLWKRTSRSHRLAGQERSGGFVELGPLQCGPSPQENLRELERQARGEEACG